MYRNSSAYAKKKIWQFFVKLLFDLESEIVQCHIPILIAITQAVMRIDRSPHQSVSARICSNNTAMD